MNNNKKTFSHLTAKYFECHKNYRQFKYGLKTSFIAFP
jgi:hypothetical protein